MDNKTTFPLEQFRQKLKDSPALKKSLQPWMEQFLKPNMEWNFAIIAEIHRVITTKLQNIAIKFGGLCAIRILMDTCSIPLVNLIQCYLANPIMQVALYKCTDDTPERGIKYFTDNGYPQNTPDIERYGFNYVKLATQMLIVAKDIKPNKLFEDEQMETPSLFTLIYKNLLSKGLTPSKTLQFFKGKKPQELRNNFIKKLQQFNNESPSYSGFFVKGTSSLIEAGFNENYSGMDLRKMLVSGDLYISTPSLDKILQYLEKSHNFKHKTNAILLLNQFVRVADFQAYYNVIETKPLRDIAAKILSATGNDQEKPKSIYPEIKGQLEQKQAFYLQFIKCIHLWSECYPVDLLHGKGVTKIKQVYQKMKVSEVKFPNQQIETFKKRYLEASKANQERIERLKQAYLPDDIPKPQQPNHKSSIQQSPTKNNNIQIKQTKTNQSNVKPPQKHVQMPIKVLSMKDKILQAANLLKQPPKNSKQLNLKMAKLIEFKGQFENYVLKSEQSQQQTQKYLEKGYQIIDRVQEAAPLYGRYTNGQTQLFPKICLTLTASSGIFVDYQPIRQSQWPKNGNKLTDTQQVKNPITKNDKHHQIQHHNKQPHKISTHNIQPHKIQQHKIQHHNIQPHKISTHNIQPHKKQPHNKQPHNISNHKISTHQYHQYQQKQFKIQQKYKISQNHQSQSKISQKNVVNQSPIISNKVNLNQKVNHEENVQFEQSNLSKSSFSESNFQRNSKNINKKQMFESPINKVQLNFSKKNRIQQNYMIQIDDRIQQPQITPLEESFHDIKQIQNTLKQNPKPTFKSCFNDKYIYGKDNKKQKLYWLENDSINLIKGNKRNPSGSKVSVPQLLQERNNKFHSQIQYIQNQKQKTIKLLEKKIQKLESSEQVLKRQVQSKEKQIRLFKQQSDISESGSNHKNYIQDQYYLFKNKVSIQNTTPLKYYNNHLNDIQPQGKLIPLKNYSNLFLQFQNYKEKKNLLKHKDLLLKTDSIQIGCMSYRQNSILVLNLYITPANYIQQVTYSIISQSDHNLQIKYYPEKIKQIRGKKQQKITFQIAINNFQYKLPYFLLNYIQNHQKTQFQFLLPCSFHKFVQIQSVQSRQINTIMVQKKIIRGEEVPYSKKILKDIKQIVEYFPHITELDQRLNQIGQKTFGGKCSFGKNVFYIRICVKVNQFLYVQGVHIIGNQKLMQFYICLVTYLLHKKID